MYLKKETWQINAVQRWDNVLSRTSSLLTQFRECSGTDRLLEPVVPPLVVSGWKNLSCVSLSISHIFTDKFCQGEELSAWNRRIFSLRACKCECWRGRFIPMSGNDIQLRTPPQDRCPAEPLRTVNYVHHFSQHFHSDLGQQTLRAVGWSHFGASITSLFPDGDPDFQQINLPFH